MITDFVWLDFVEQTTDSLRCSISLPDSNLYSDDDMILCGNVSCNYLEQQNSISMNIIFQNNLFELCAGETYQRKAMVQTIIYLLKVHFGVNAPIVWVNIIDYWGSYHGTPSTIDETMWRGNNENK